MLLGLVFSPELEVGQAGVVVGGRELGIDLQGELALSFCFFTLAHIEVDLL